MRAYGTLADVTTSRPKLTVLVGAGGSLELGIPSTGDATATTKAALRTSPTVVSRACPFSLDDVVNQLLSRCTSYFGDAFNFEHLFHVLEAVASMGEARRTAVPSTGKIVEAMLAAGPHPDIVAAVDDPYFAPSAQRSFFGALHDAFASKSAAAVKEPAWNDIVGFWRRLDSKFDLSIATLNYDTLIEQALGLAAEDQGFEPVSGEVPWRFNERVLRGRPRLMHLHGSIHFGHRGSGVDLNRFAYEDDWEDLYWYPTPDAARRAEGMRSSHPSQAGRTCIKGPFITGLNKPDKLMVEPYGAYMRVFADQLQTTHRVLVIGYGFGDLHVNALLARMSKAHGSSVRAALITREDLTTRKGLFELQHERREMTGIVHRWSRDDDVFIPVEYVNPIRSSDGRVCIYCEGLRDVAQTSTDEIIRFLAHPWV